MFLPTIFVFSWTFLMNVYVISGNSEYCNFSSIHVLCEEGFDERCGGEGNYIFEDITDGDIKVILETHNNFRNELAAGTVVGGRGPGGNLTEETFSEAANMEELKWDEELENISIGVVKKCTFEHICADSSCIRTTRHPHVSDNLFIIMSEMNLQTLYDSANYFNAIETWWKERDLYLPSDISSFRSGPTKLAKLGFSEFGHFTVMIWAEVMRIGCAKIGFPSAEDGQNQVIIVCHYAPGANIIDSPIYEEGEPCSRCAGEGRTCSSEYENLCAADGRPNDVEAWEFVIKETTTAAIVPQLTTETTTTAIVPQLTTGSLVIQPPIISMSVDSSSSRNVPSEGVLSSSFFCVFIGICFKSYVQFLLNILM